MYKVTRSFRWSDDQLNDHLGMMIRSSVDRRTRSPCFKPEIDSMSRLKIFVHFLGHVIKHVTTLLTASIVPLYNRVFIRPSTQLSIAISRSDPQHGRRLLRSDPQHGRRIVVPEHPGQPPQREQRQHRVEALFPRGSLPSSYAGRGKRASTRWCPAERPSPLRTRRPAPAEARPVRDVEHGRRGLAATLPVRLVERADRGLHHPRERRRSGRLRRIHGGECAPNERGPPRVIAARDRTPDGCDPRPESVDGNEARISAPTTSGGGVTATTSAASPPPPRTTL